MQLWWITKSVNNEKHCEFQDWLIIVAIDAAADHIVGLKEGGTVVATGNSDYGACDVGGWTDIVSIATSYGATVGLKATVRLLLVAQNLLVLMKLKDGETLLQLVLAVEILWLEGERDSSGCWTGYRRLARC